MKIEIKKTFYIKVFSLSALLLFFVILSSCDNITQPKNNNSQILPPDTGQILPLNTGNSWTYIRTMSWTDSTKVDSVTMSITKKDSLDGVTGYDVKNLIIGPSLIFGGFMLDNHEDGLYMIMISTIRVPPTSPAQEKVLSFPTKAGDTTSFMSYLITTESIDQPVTAAAGTFRCVKYVIRQDTSVVGIIWSEPRVGLVRTWAQYGAMKVSCELNSYSLK